MESIFYENYRTLLNVNVKINIRSQGLNYHGFETVASSIYRSPPNVPHLLRVSIFI